VTGVLSRLAEQLGLKREYVIEDTVDAPALESMLGDHSGALEVAAKG
jgi:hypothetical protein